MEVPRDRVYHRAVKDAARSTLAAASVADPPLTSTEWRVLAAVVSFTAIFSKLEEEMHLGQLAACVFYGTAAGEPVLVEVRDQVAEWQTKKIGQTLRKLRDRELVRYVPPVGRGRGARSLIGLCIHEKYLDTETLSEDVKGSDAETPSDPERVLADTDKGSQPDTEKGPDAGTPPGVIRSNRAQMRSARALARNRARVEDFTEDDLREELKSDFRNNGHPVDPRIIDEAVDVWRRTRISA